MTDEDREAAVWFQIDAAYLHRCADAYREQGDDWLAIRVQNNAAHSARMARHFAGIEPTPQPTTTP